MCDQQEFILYILLMYRLIYFPGEYSILYLFVRYKFGWNEIDYSLYAAYKMTGILIGNINIDHA
jgi:PCFT/HCP family folate transporter-like MFS transporter 1/3